MLTLQKADSLAFDARETLKPNARKAMEELQQSGIEVYMMSGDKEEAVGYWASMTGIKHYKSKVMPQDKEKLVEGAASQWQVCGNGWRRS